MDREHTYAAIVLNIACGCPVEADDVAGVIDDLGPEERERLCRALVAVGALDARQALVLLGDAAGEDARALGAAASEGVAQ